MVWEPSRDFVGYGEHPPDPHWPGGARLAINFVLNYEEGSEASFDLGDGRTETRLSEATRRNGPGQRDLAAETMFEYGSRVGFWRIRRLFEAAGVPLTVFACVLALERNEEAAAAIRRSDWDICSHGWRWVDHMDLDEATEREHIAKAVTSLTETVGAPAGWYCRYGPSNNTRRLLVEHGGFTYDSDAYNDELPYWVDVDGTDRLVVPYSMMTNDGKMLAGLTGGGDWYEFVRDAVDLMRREGASQPKMMSIGLHNRLIGHPSRAVGLERLLDYVVGLEDVWITRRVEIAEHWRSVHPAPREGPE